MKRYFPAYKVSAHPLVIKIHITLRFFLSSSTQLNPMQRSEAFRARRKN